MNYQQRNKIVNDPDAEFDNFLSEQISGLRSVRENFVTPVGKELTKTRKQGKALIELLKVLNKIKKVSEENKLKEAIGDVKYSCHLETKSKVNAKSKQDFLMLGLKYVDLKKKYIKNFL
jgi:hypothetical protein